MALTIRDINGVPPERWKFQVEATGFMIEAPSWTMLYPFVETHCKANNVPTPSLQEVIDWCCANLHIPCYESETRVPLVNMFTQSLPVAPTSCCSKGR
jgi:hypothetical protein